MLVSVLGEQKIRAATDVRSLPEIATEIGLPIRPGRVPAAQLRTCWGLECSLLSGRRFTKAQNRTGRHPRRDTDVNRLANLFHTSRAVVLRASRRTRSATMPGVTAPL